MDNTFATANDIGILGQKNIKFKGSIGRQDRADTYKFTIAPGASIRLSSSYTLNGDLGSSLNAAVYIQNPLTGQIQQSSRQVFKVGKKNFPLFTPASPVPLTGYLKFDRPMRNISYQATIAALGS